MPDITVKHLDDMERYTGSFQHGQQFYFAGKSLALSKLGMNAIRMPPNWEHYPEHDHAAENEEELYIQDLKSANGTYVDDSFAAQATPISTESKIQLGACVGSLRLRRAYH